jgi:uncharacterized protein (DUF1800 family)
MADRRSTSPRRRAPNTSAGAPGSVATQPVPPQPMPADLRTANAPLVDLIFPNRTPSGNDGYAPTVADLDRAAGFGPPGDGQHRKRLFGRKRSVAKAAYRPIVDKPVRRRRVLLGLGTGVVAAGGVGGAVALLAGGIGTAPSTASPRLNTAAGLGASGLADSPSAAAKLAAAATPAFPTPLTRDPELHLLRRATFGPTLVDVVALKQMGIDAWLERQFSPQGIADPGGDAVVATFPTVSMSTADLHRTLKDEGDNTAQDELPRATIGRQIWSSRQLFEVMVDFWSNHLNVQNPFDGGWDSRTPYDNEVIRAHALGRFSEMLSASARSVAMMRYLDNASSKKKSVNENYGRELLELHTVGLDAKYSEVDVRQSAYLMTGRMVDRNSVFYFDKNQHYVGPVQVLGFAHPNNDASQGLEVGEQYLTYLATHPSTARRIAFKLARRFVCDDPPQSIVDRLTQSYLDNGTAIIPVLRTLFSSVEFWMSTGLKTRRPLENVVATSRILGIAPGAKTADGLDGVHDMLNQLGHAPLAWGPPDGYPDVADYWGSAHATLGMWNSHRALLLGSNKGLTYPKSESFVGLQPATVGQYLDTVSLRLVHQPMQPAHKQALLTFLGAKNDTAVKDLRLGGKSDQLVPLVLDSVYHALR